jgi:hypothetical protein
MVDFYHLSINLNNEATMALKKEYSQFHQDGTPLLEVIEWLKKVDRDLLNG